MLLRVFLIFYLIIWGFRMNGYESDGHWAGREQDKKLKEGYEAFWNQWNWEWFCSLNLASNNLPVANNKVKIWCRDLCKSEGIQIASMGIYSTIPMPHVHLLVFGKNRYGKILSGIDGKKWEDVWKRLTKRNAVIKDVYDVGGAVRYTSYFNTPPNLSEMVTPYNKQLLKKAMTRPIGIL